MEASGKDYTVDVGSITFDGKVAKAPTDQTERQPVRLRRTNFPDIRAKLDFLKDYLADMIGGAGPWGSVDWVSPCGPIGSSRRWSVGSSSGSDTPHPHGHSGARWTRWSLCRGCAAHRGGSGLIDPALCRRWNPGGRVPRGARKLQLCRLQVAQKRLDAAVCRSDVVRSDYVDEILRSLAAVGWDGWATLSMQTKRDIFDTQVLDVARSLVRVE